MASFVASADETPSTVDSRLQNHDGGPWPQKMPKHPIRRSISGDDKLSSIFPFVRGEDGVLLLSRANRGAAASGPPAANHSSALLVR